MLQINASVVLHQDKYWCAYRTQNLFRFNSFSFISELNEDLDPVSNKPLIAANGNPAFEDVRLFSTGDTLLAFYTYMPKTETGWIWHFGVGYGEVDAITGVIKNQVSLRSFSKRKEEKNWVPYIYNNEVFVITDFDPFLRILKVRNSRGETDINEIYLSTDKTKGWPYGEIRGGTPLIAPPGPVSNWLYGFVHSHLSNNNGYRRFYYYTAVRFDPLTKRVEYHQPPLHYDDSDIDSKYTLLWHKSNKRELKVIFPIGIMHYNNGIIVSFGKDDVCSYTDFFSWEYIYSLFE